MNLSEIAEDIFNSDKQIFIITGDDYSGKMDLVRVFNDDMDSLTHLPLNIISKNDSDSREEGEGEEEIDYMLNISVKILGSKNLFIKTNYWENLDLGKIKSLVHGELFQFVEGFLGMKTQIPTRKLLILIDYIPKFVLQELTFIYVQN